MVARTKHLMLSWSKHARHRFRHSATNTGSTMERQSLQALVHALALLPLSGHHARLGPALVNCTLVRFMARPMPRSDWARYAVCAERGVELLHAHYTTHVYDRHSHDAYVFGVTLEGVQAFNCRGRH